MNSDKFFLVRLSNRTRHELSGNANIANNGAVGSKPSWIERINAYYGTFNVHFEIPLFSIRSRTHASTSSDDQPTARPDSVSGNDAGNCWQAISS
jgi:hypothetical protein